MQLYLDTSALVKLVVVEAESSALQRYLGEFPGDIRFTAALARTELVRAVAPRRSIEIIEHARHILAKLDFVALSNRLLDAAGTLAPPELRTLDAIHLAAALTAPDLRAMVTYHGRLAQAAANAGITVAQPRRK
jgi:uncharacterized protein